MNPLFQKVITGVEQQVKERDPYDRIVAAGLKTMFDKSTHAMMLEGLNEAQDVAKWAGEGIAGLLGVLSKQSRGTMPFQPMLQAGVTLLMHAMDFLSETGKIEASPQSVAQATKAFAMAITNAAGVSEQQLMQMAEQANAAAGDPAQAQRLQQHFGGGNGAN